MVFDSARFGGVGNCVDVWSLSFKFLGARNRSQLPQPWELEQLVHLPRCRVCRTVSVPAVCAAMKGCAFGNLTVAGSKF